MLLGKISPSWLKNGGVVPRHFTIYFVPLRIFPPVSLIQHHVHHENYLRDCHMPKSHLEKLLHAANTEPLAL
jgi:hypothetical protein